MFLKGNRSSQVFRFPCLKSRDLFLAESSWPDNRAKTLSSSLAAYLIYLPCYWTNPRSDIFIWKFVHWSRFLCKTIFIFATLSRTSDCSKWEHTLLAPDLKSEHQRILAIVSFILTTLYSCVRIEKKLVHTSLWTMKIDIQHRRQGFCGQIPVLSLLLSSNIGRAHSAHSKKTLVLEI